VAALYGKANKDFASLADLFHASDLFKYQQAFMNTQLEIDHHPAQPPPHLHTQAPRRVQFNWLLWRFFTELVRLPWMHLRFGLTLAYVFFISFALFPTTRNLNSAGAVQSLSVSMKWLLITLCSLNAQQSKLVWVQRAGLLKREVKLGLYKSWVFALACLVGEYAYLVAQVCLYASIFFFTNGLQELPWWLFLYFVLVLLLAESICTHVSMLLVATFDSYGMDSVGSVLSLFSLFAGTQIPGSKIPNWLLGLYYISPFRWTMEAVVSTQAEYITTVFCNPFGNLTTKATFFQCPLGGANATLLSGEYAACCDAQTPASPVTVQQFVLNPVTGYWGAQPNGFQYSWAGYDVLYLGLFWVAVQVLFVIAVGMKVEA
jgi:hypothetical protein